MIGGQDEDSCGKSGIDETPQVRSDEEAHRPPAESEVLYGNQQRCNKRFSSCIQFVRLMIGAISLCFNLFFN
ncbi:hypothetical protein [Priestia megaterium]|uniref:hypothetical protein n=1 Tax=Priestia megaterium TaxID=1404 RepID=UPI0021F42CC1|nr:hypothetical protein [Priestia megaterium]UYP11080.1 hypothetical protein OIJ04_10465 [Priestia megaterium]